MDIWPNILIKLKDEKKVMLLFVASHKGSSPGKQGFKMLVSDDGFLFGSIGGGLAEFNLVERAKDLLQENATKSLLVKQVHRTNEPNSSGMICAGEQLVVLYPMERDLIPTLNNIIANKKGLLSITPESFEFNTETILEGEVNFQKSDEDSWHYQENINRVPHLYIIGGGHVGLATSRLFSMLDFKVSLFDNRRNLNTFEENQSLNSKFVVDYENIAEYIPEGHETYIVVMTHNYEDDKLILKELHESKFHYLGLLGSNSKIKTLINNLISEGFDKEALSRIDAPIGIDINSQTPAEIAVSIAAKIISIKNQ